MALVVVILVDIVPLVQPKLINGNLLVINPHLDNAVSPKLRQDSLVHTYANVNSAFISDSVVS